jgi:signal transduction histidine kinase
MKILIVDDSAITRKLIAGHLEDIPDMEFEIFEATNGQQAVDMFESKNPDLMLLDYLLQDVNGIDIVHILRKKHDVLPVIMVTGFDDVQLVAEAVYMGVQGYILKDRLSADTLLWAIRDAQQKLEMQKTIRTHRLEIEGFARTVAHNLRDKMSSVNGLLGLAEEYEGLDDKKRREFIQAARSAAEHAHAYLEELFSHVAMAQQAPDKISFPVDKMVAEAAEDVRAKHPDASFEIRHGALPVAYGAYPMIYAVFRHLFENALRYSGAGNLIVTVDAEEQPYGWLIRVKDNGRGVSETDKDRIFRLFERGGASRGTPGAGIGLATCKRIVEELHGGRIWAVPTSHGGCFCFTLPKAGEAEGYAASAA